jgi:hypothetical protein
MLLVSTTKNFTGKITKAKRNGQAGFEQIE